MDHHINDFYQTTSEDAPRGNFHRVIPLHEKKDYGWNEIKNLAPDIPKGWYELARLTPQDRIDFIREFWISKLTAYPKLPNFLGNFFSHLDDIGIFLIQRKFDDPYECHLIYSIRNNGGFFTGLPPASEANILKLKQSFPEIIFPEDFLRFLSIHDGFSKTTDTGIIRSFKMLENYTAFQEMLSALNSVETNSGEPVNPKTLIPFYESFGMPFFQCFWAEWYPENEMGNVYFSNTTKTISNVKCRDLCSENLAFPTFAEWLIFYLETIE